MTKTRTSIEKAILEIVGNDWMTLPQITSKISIKLGINPDQLGDQVALYIGILIGESQLEHKQVTPEGSNGYFYMCRKPQQ